MAGRGTIFPSGARTWTSISYVTHIRFGILLSANGLGGVIRGGKDFGGSFRGSKIFQVYGAWGPENDEWEGVDKCTDYSEPSQYFPNYKFDGEDPHWVLGWDIPEPPESMDKYVHHPGIPISRFY